MQALAKTSSAGTAYTASQVLSQLFSPDPVQETWVFYRLAADGVFLSDLSPYVDYAGTSPEVSHDTTRAVKRTCRLRIRGDATLNPLQDLVQPRYRLFMGDGGYVEWSLGVFSLIPLDAEIQPAQTWHDVTMPDLTQLLVDASFVKSFAVPRGTNYATAVKQIVASAGLPTPLPVSIPGVTQTLPAALSWDYGTSRLQAINDLLAAINYHPIWCDEDGRLRSSPIPDWNTVSASATFDATSNQANTLQAITVRQDPSQAYNQVLVVGEDPRRAAVTALYVNNNPASPVSVNRWHPKLFVHRDSAIPDQGAAWSKARALAQEHARIFSEYSHQSLAWPVSQDNDVFSLIYQTTDEGSFSSLCLEVGWTHRCKVGQPTDHRLSVIVPS